MKERIKGLLSLWLALSLAWGLLLVPAAAADLSPRGVGETDWEIEYTEDGWVMWGSWVFFGSSGGGGATPAPDPEVPFTVTVYISGDESLIGVAGTVSHYTVFLSEVREELLNKVIGPEVRTGMVVVDMSHLPIAGESISFPVDVLKQISGAVADPGNDASGLTVLLPVGRVVFDAAALAAVSGQLDSTWLQLTFDVDTARLNDAQRAAAEGLDVLDKVDVSLQNTPSRTPISDFRGGSVQLGLPLTDGLLPLGLRVWYLGEDGQLTARDSRCRDGAVVWSADHFSDYIVTRSDLNGYASCAKDDACPADGFTDIDAGAWYHDGVHFSLEHGLLAGLSDGHFAPDEVISRAMLVTTLWRLEGEPSDNPSAGLRDVKAGLWYTEAVDWAYANGIVTGDGKGGFGPLEPLTREELAVILWRYAQYRGCDVSVGEDTNILSYEDAFAISESAIPALQWACGAGLIQGSGGRLSPAGSTSRAQLATVLMRLCESMAAGG